jgi:hypothetical protein
MPICGRNDLEFLLFDKTSGGDSMKIFGMRPAIVLGVLLLGSTIAQAAQINYTTTGSFDGGSNVKAFGSGTLTFESASGPVFASPFTFASLGTIRTAGFTGFEDLSGTTLTITVNQTLPGPANTAAFSTTITGTISGTASTAIIDFAGIQEVTISSVLYKNTQETYQLVPQSTASGATTIQGSVEVVPEPGTTLLLSTGFAVIALAGRKLRRQN